MTDIVEAIVQRFELKPGEVVVLTFPDALTFDQAEAIKRRWSDQFPTNRCIVITWGGRVTGVLTEETA